MSTPYRRQSLPKAAARLPLGRTGLSVSPLCIGITEDAETIPAAFDAGINFFFLTADLHWPLYEQLRKGLTQLLSRGPSIRDQIVVGVVSYLDQPLFQALQFHEVIESVPGLQRVDLLIAGAIPNEQSFFGRPNEQATMTGRYQALNTARTAGHAGARAIGASFHDRRTALLSISYGCLDIQYIRYNTAHPGAATDIFPYLRPDRASLIFNFKSVLSQVTPERFKQLGLDERYWLPKPTDYYRFVLTNPNIDGILCSPSSPAQLAELVAALEQPPLTAEEEDYMIRLSSAATPRYF
jgi:aryl-alcohol dehydrogenase-like predicted oxidoreductase